MPKRKAAPDWRATLFSWRGRLKSANCSGAAVVTTQPPGWRGSWVPIAHPGTEPSSEDYACSENTFEATIEFGVSDSTGGAGSSSDASATLRALAGAETIAIAATYKLDQGDGSGLQSYSDESQRLAVGPVREGSDGADEVAIVAAYGSTTEFGRFSSFGSIERRGEELVLTLMRRYVDDRDPRAAWADARTAFNETIKLASAAASVPADAVNRHHFREALPWRLDSKLKRTDA
jgi:hypothetical protein